MSDLGCCVGGLGLCLLNLRQRRTNTILCLVFVSGLVSTSREQEDPSAQNCVSYRLAKNSGGTIPADGYGVGLCVFQSEIRPFTGVAGIGSPKDTLTLTCRGPTKHRSP